jgi:signal transduction histidine kinase
MEDYVKIAFTDNGIGFEKEYADRIFQIFQRLHGKSEYPGSGIGLAICKKIVDRHKGLIRVDSAPLKGSVFSLFLPIHH